MGNVIEEYKYIISFLAPRLHMYLMKISDALIGDLQEIRIRADRPIILVSKSGCCFLTNNGKTSLIASSNCVCAYKNEITETVNKMCGYSMHSHYEDLLNGYVTLPNGARIGLVGTAVFEKDKVKGVKDITSINIRIPRNITGISEDIMNIVFKNGIEDLLIVGSPSSGKTTLLKDIASQLSSGRLGKYYKICVIDERKELFPINISVNSVGPNTDVLSGYPKSQGIAIAVRTLSPDVIICDEIVHKNELDEILNGMNSGVKFILTIHASSIEDLERKYIFKKLFSSSGFNKIVLLEGSDKPGIVREIIDYNEIKYENCIDIDIMRSNDFDICKTN